MVRGIPKSVLIADNVQERRLALCTIINRCGYNVFVADNEASFSRMFLGLIPHVAILNLRMPLIGGQPVIEGVKAVKAWDAVAIVAMSGRGDQKLLPEGVQKSGK